MNKVPNDVSPNSQPRRKELLNTVSSGIHSPRAFVIDVGLQFVGKDKTGRYAMTFAYCQSSVDEKVQAILFYNKKSIRDTPFLLNSVMAAKVPNSPITNLKKVQQFNKYPQGLLEIRYGMDISNGSQISIEANMNQTPQRKEYLKQHPVVKQCEQEIQKGDFMMPACRKAVTFQSTVDRVTMRASYNNINLGLKRILADVHSMSRQMGYQYIDEDWITHKGKEQQIELDVQLRPDMNTMNISMELPSALITYNNVPVTNSYVKSFFAREPSVPMYRRILKQFYGRQFNR